MAKKIENMTANELMDSLVLFNPDNTPDKDNDTLQATKKKLLLAISNPDVPGDMKLIYRHDVSVIQRELDKRSMAERINTSFNRIFNDELPADAFKKIDEKYSMLSKTFRFSIPRGTKEEITISNRDVLLSVERITAARDCQNLMAYVIAKEFARLADMEKALSDMGFKDVADFGAHVFGYKSVTVNQYARIGKYFIDDNYQTVAYLPGGMSISAMVELLSPATDEKGNFHPEWVIDWYEKGLLSDGMSRDNIRRALKSALKQAITDGTEKQDSATETTETSTDSVTDSATETAPETTEKQASPVDAVSIIDRLNDMTPDAAAGQALNALQIVEAVCGKFAENMDAKTHINALRDIARNIAGLE